MRRRRVHLKRKASYTLTQDDPVKRRRQAAITILRLSECHPRSSYPSPRTPPRPVRRSARLATHVRRAGALLCPTSCTGSGTSPGSTYNMSRTGLPVPRADPTNHNKENLYTSIRKKVKKCLTRGGGVEKCSLPVQVEVEVEGRPPLPAPRRTRTMSATSTTSSGISMGRRSLASSSSSHCGSVGRLSHTSTSTRKLCPTLLEDSGRASSVYGSQSEYSARIAACLAMSEVRDSTTRLNETYASIPASLPYANNTYPALPTPPLPHNDKQRFSWTSAKSSTVDFSSRPLPPIPLPQSRTPLTLSSRANIPVPSRPPPEGSVELVRTIHLSKTMQSLWVSGLAVTRKNELVVVDLRDAFLLDHNGNVKRSIGARGPHRLFEPIDVTVMPSGNLAFSDHAERDVKVFTSRGQFVRQVVAPCQTNIAGVACTHEGELIIAGTDRQVLTVHAGDDGRLLHTLPAAASLRQLEHPYSVAVNPLTGDILVGDDSKQLLTAMSPDGKVIWRFCPSGDRHFFPSSVCVDDVGYVFVADLYNEKVYMLDSSGKFLKTLLSRGHGLKGGPGALAVDNRGHLYVADEERTIKVFKYGENGFALYRRFKSVDT